MVYINRICGIEVLLKVYLNGDGGNREMAEGAAGLGNGGGGNCDNPPGKYRTID
jgi:hypothetical protein